MYQRDLQNIQSYTNLDLFDKSFWIYRKMFQIYLRLVLLLLIFFSLITFAILSGEIATERPPLVSFLWILEGNTPPGSSQPIAAILRDTSFFDGAIPWVVASAIFASLALQIPLPNETRMRLQLYGRILLLSLLNGVFIIICRILGFGIVSDLMRIPLFLAPYIIIVEKKPILDAISCSIYFISRNPLQSSITFALSLASVRLVIAGTFSGSVLLSQFIVRGSISETFLRWFIPLCVLVLESIFYPAIHTFLALYYYKLLTCKAL